MIADLLARVGLEQAVRQGRLRRSGTG
jgi:hypothetical protein